MEAVEEDWERAAAIVAHPDDLEYGVASAIARWTGQGKDVAYVIATSGEAGIAGMSPAEARTVRREEELRSAAAVGVRHVEFLDHVDGVVEYGTPLRRDLAGAIRRLRPHVVVGLNFELTWGESSHVNHADHRAVGLATLDACRDAANEWVFPDIGEPWRGVRAVYMAASEPATHYVDVTETLDAAVASLREHRVYLEALGTAFDPEEFLRARASEAGTAAGCALAVTFRAFDAG